MARTSPIGGHGGPPLPRRPPVNLRRPAVMPDHIHVVIGIGADVATEPDGTDGGGISNRRPEGAASTDLGEVVRRFKTFVAHRYAIGVAEWGWPRYHGHVWQRGYFDRIVRDEGAAVAIRHYVLANPRCVPTRSLGAALRRRLLGMDSHLGDTGGRLRE